MSPANKFSDSDSAIALLALGIDVAILLTCTAIKRDLDFVGFAFAGLVVGWMLGLGVLRSYRTRKPRKKLFFFLVVHLIPLPAALYFASH